MPAIAALRAQFPAACLEVLGYPHIVQLAVEGGLVNGVRSIEARALAGFFARNGTLEGNLVDYFSEFDVIISYLYDPDEIFRANIGLCCSGQYIVGPHRPEEAGDLHASAAFLKPLEQLAIFDADPVPRLSLGSEASSAGELATHPGSGSEKKNWPEAKWAELLKYLVDSTRFKLLLVGGEAEGARLSRLRANLPRDRSAVAQNLPLPELGRRLEGCVGFIGHDSGISHLAAALGLRCLLLWGESAERIWRPPSEKVRILCGGNHLLQLPVALVAEEVLNLWDSPASGGNNHV